MGISLYHNLTADNAAGNLQRHYQSLGSSIQRLSTGLRINSAADDASGLAIRELQRADIAAYEQGIRNVNDAISLIQTTDGALGIIDEKLIRMKELAEQAATGTYDSTQRLMIDSEFQAMGAEIDRIARSTDFNGIKLIDGNMGAAAKEAGRAVRQGRLAEGQEFVVTNVGSVENAQFSATNSFHNIIFSNGVDALNFIDADNPEKTIHVSGTVRSDSYNGTMTLVTQEDSRLVYDLGGGAGFETIEFSANEFETPPAVLKSPTVTYDPGTGNWSMTNDGKSLYVMNDVSSKAGAPNGYVQYPKGLIFSEVKDADGKKIMVGDMANKDTLTAFSVNTGTGKYNYTVRSFDPDVPSDEYSATYLNKKSWTADGIPLGARIQVTLANGGYVTLYMDNPLADGDTVSFDITFAGEVQGDPIVPDPPYPGDGGDDPDPGDIGQAGAIPDNVVRIHFGPMNDAAEDFYDIEKRDATLAGLGLEGVEIKTQQEAQEALVTINDAIVKKDGIRSYYGTMQNRLENTASAQSFMAENLQAAESRISDADIANEMMTFVRNQILTQSAVAMVAQANSMPQRVMRLIG